MPRPLHLEAWSVICVGGDPPPVSTMLTVTPDTVGGVAGRSNVVPGGAVARILATFTLEDRMIRLPGTSSSAARAWPPVARATRHASPSALLTELLGIVVLPVFSGGAASHRVYRR
jgi:hypothetical protein